MGDMSQVIIPKSDQLNADDLIAGPKTITVTAVTIRGGQEQPIAISFEGDNGKPYKACKSMCRIMVMAWGADSKQYVGRSMTLYRDPSVKWGGMDVGGIRISHMSDIDAAFTTSLTVTKASRKPFTVKPLAKTAPPKRDDAAFVTPEQIAQLETRCADTGISLAALKERAKVATLDELPASRFKAAMDWIDKQADAVATA